MPDASTGPDISQLASLIRASQAQGGSGTSPLGFKMELNVGQGASLQSAALIKFDGKFQARAPKRPGMFSKLLSDIGFNQQDFVKGFQDAQSKGAIAATPVQEASITDITGQSHGLGGGSFVDNLSGLNRPSGGAEIG